MDTFTAGVRYAAIPDKLNLSLRYAASHGVDSMRLNLATGALPTGGQFPRFDDLVPARGCDRGLQAR